jgi:hypothetical protein
MTEVAIGPNKDGFFVPSEVFFCWWYLVSTELRYQSMTHNLADFEP